MQIYPESLNDEAIVTFERDGVVCLRDVIDDNTLTLLRVGLQRGLTELRGPYFRDLAGDGKAYTDMFRWQAINEYRRAGCESIVPAIAGQLMRANETVFIEDQMFLKKAGTMTGTPWHHDMPYYPLRGRMCVVWIPLTEHATADSLHLVAGSHKWGCEFVPVNLSGTTGHQLYADPNNLPPGVKVLGDINAQRERHRILAWHLVPGDCIVFSALTLHGNHGNSSAKDVARVALRYGAEELVGAPNKYPWVFTKWPFDALVDGDRIIGERFPLVWRRNQGAVA